MKPKLVALPTCPYVQRAVIVLNVKGVDFDHTFIDKSDKPMWFLEISPRGKVPVLVWDDVGLFESQAICEFLEEVYPDPPLLPDDPVLRARDRAWFAWAADDFFPPVTQMLFTKYATRFRHEADILARRLSRLDRELGGRDYMSGDGSRFGMADAAILPAFTRLAFLEERGVYDWPRDVDGVIAWKDRVLAMPEVQDSVPDLFDDILSALMRNQAAWAASG